MTFLVRLALIILTYASFSSSAHVGTFAVGDILSMQARADGLFNVICKDGRFEEGVSVDAILANRVCEPVPVQRKIDVLFLIDNSASMHTSQANLAANLPQVLQRWKDQSYDFQIAVITTDAYLALPAWETFYSTNPGYFDGEPQEWKAWFRDGTLNNRSGYRVLNQSTPDLNENLIKNIQQGITGRGDERPFLSLKTAIESAGNANFVRPDSFVGVVILSDEDDFSHDGLNAIMNPADPTLHSIASYVAVLDTWTNSSAPRRYSVSSVAVQSQDCLNQLGIGFIGYRLAELADFTGGVKANICGDFASELELIFNSLAEQSIHFR